MSNCGESATAIHDTEATARIWNRNTADVQLNNDHHKNEQPRNTNPVEGDQAFILDSAIAIDTTFRRHSLPSTGTVSLLSSPHLGTGDLAQSPVQNSQVAHLESQQQQQQQQQQETESQAPQNTNTTKYGHRSTRSTQTLPDQPVLVRSYSPRPENNMNTSFDENAEDSERVELPPIDAFSFDGILKSIDPKVSRTIETVTQLSSGYRANLTHETDLLIEAQQAIDTQIMTADRLSNQVLKTTNARSDKLKSEAAPFRNGTAVEELAQSAENAYAMVENIIATLQAVDGMLPSQDQLGTDDSPHKFHYPYTHSLLAVKAQEIRRRNDMRAHVTQSSSYSSPSTGNSRPAAAVTVGSASSRGALSPTSQVPIRHRHRAAPLIQYNYPPISVQQRKMSSPPNMTLRTIMPSPSPDTKPPVATPTVASPSSNNKAIAVSASMAHADRDSRSLLAASLGGAAPSTRSSFSFKNILWGSSWGRGSRSSVGAVSRDGGSQVGGETAEERLRKIMGNQTAKGKTVDGR